MNLFDSEFYLQLVNHLYSLNDSDFEEDPFNIDAIVPTFSVIPEVTIANETKKKLYSSSEFKRFLREFIERRFKVKKDRITDAYSEKIYRKIYDRDLVKNASYNTFTKIMYHPDVTKSDYELIRDKRARFPKYVLYNEVGCFTLMIMAYYGTSLRKKVKANPILGGAMLGAAPIIVLFTTQKMSSVLLDMRVRQMNLHTKYGIKRS